MPGDLQATDLNPAWLERVRARPTEKGDTPHALVVHDERSMREILKLHLATAGYSVAVLKDGTQIRAELARRAADVVIVDMSLPYIDGVEFFVAEPDGQLIPVVFLSEDDKTRARAERLGAIACVTQPLYADLFLDAVGRALRSRGTAGLRAGLRRPAGPSAAVGAG